MTGFDFDSGWVGTADLTCGPNLEPDMQTRVRVLIATHQIVLTVGMHGQEDPWRRWWWSAAVIRSFGGPLIRITSGAGLDDREAAQRHAEEFAAESVRKWNAEGIAAMDQATRKDAGR